MYVSSHISSLEGVDTFSYFFKISANNLIDIIHEMIIKSFQLGEANSKCQIVFNLL
jgi:hypothetical protein